MEFFSLKKLHHVFKYTEYDELTSQLCIQGIKRNICVFFFYEYNPIDALTLKRNPREICSWRKSNAKLLQTKVLTLFFWNLHRNPGSQS